MITRPRRPARARALPALIVTGLLTAVTAVVAAPVVAAPVVAAPVVAAPVVAAPVRQLSYVALGDSYSAGLGTGRYDLAGAPCLRSSQAFAAQWTRQRPTRSFRFLACSGATTVETALVQVPQIPKDADVVTLTVGGNDAGFASILRRCSTAARDSTCTTAIRLGEAAALTSASAGVGATVRLVRRKAPGATVVVLGYPRLFEPGPCTVPGVPTERRRAALNKAADVLNASLARAAQRAGARFVDVRQRFAGHGVCARPGQEWINGPSSRPEAYHPNRAGHELGYLPALRSATG